MAMNAIRRIAAATSVAALFAVPATVVATPAAATPYPPGPGSLQLSSVWPCAGGPLLFRGTGFVPREPVAARLDTQVLTTVAADRRGTAAGIVIIPRSTTAGRHTFSLTGTSSGRRLSRIITVRRACGRTAADTASTSINETPVASQVTPDNGGGLRPTTLAAGAAAALGAFGGGSYLMHRRRRGSNPHR